MADGKDYVSISDASVPNPGRIYDYLLGGNHNFEVDRKAAEKLKSEFPEAVEDVRLIRWFLGAAVRLLSSEGFERFLDLASGLPTVDHIHNIAPSGTRVVYSDIDPVTVSYGQEIVKDLEGVAYVHADAGEPEKLLQEEVVQRLIGKGARTAVGYSGIAWFIPDEKLAHALDVIFDWVGVGSKLFVSIGLWVRSTDAGEKMKEFYSNINQPVFTRSEGRVRELFGRWKISEPGFRPLEKWIDVDDRYAQGGSLASGGTLNGAILVKE